jgi:solute carrier family 15 (peptide/histidine transporter), member 3/4
MASPVKTPGVDTPNVGPYVAAIWDSRPRKFNNVLLQVTLFILIMELAERLSYYGINQGLKNFMKVRIGWTNVSASALKSTWTSICYMSPLFGAYLADERWGRYRTIMVFGVWYCVGDFLVAIAAHPDVYAHRSTAEVIFVIGLYVGIAIGTGAIKSNVITFGADQFDPRDPKELKLKDTYFSYFYFCINFGAAFSYGYLSYLCVNGSSLIPKDYGYFATYLICACMMFFAFLSFIIGTKRYVFVEPSDNSISTLVRVIFNAPSVHNKGVILLGGTLLMFASVFINTVGAFLVEKGKTGEYLSYTSAVAVFLGIVAWIIVGLDTSFIDGAKVSHGGKFADEAIDGYKKLFRCLPFAAFTIIWHCAYDQTDANFQSITQQCDLRWSRSADDNSQVPGAMLGVFDPVVIVICIPILDSIVYPWYTRRFGKRPSQFGKATAGLIVAAIGIIWAGIFETMRRNSGPLERKDGSGPILDGGSELPMNKMYWAAAIPNYVFVALAECLINVTAYDVFYSNVPMSLKSTAMAVNLLMSSMGASLTSVFTIMFRPYLPSDDLNKGNLEYMYYTMGAVSIANLFAFSFIMKKMNFGMSSSADEDNEFLVNEKESVSSRKSFAGAN